MTLTLLILSQQSLALFYIEERRSTTRTGCMHTPGQNDLFLYIYMENVDSIQAEQYTPENIEEVRNVPPTGSVPGWATG